MESEIIIILKDDCIDSVHYNGEEDIKVSIMDYDLMQFEKTHNCSMNETKNIGQLNVKLKTENFKRIR